MSPPELLPVVTPDGVRAAFTTRRGGVSAPPFDALNLGPATGDEPASVEANLRALAGELGLARERLVLNRQVHGARVRSVLGPDAGVQDGDGLVTEVEGLALLALGADCLPVLLWRADGSAVGAVHAGWRGLLGGALEATVAALGPGALGAAVGPAVGPCCYPVDSDLRGRFAARFGPGVVRGEAVAMAAAARIVLLEAGIGRDALTVIETCTACGPERFFSYRRDGAATGRQAGVIARIAT